MSSETALAAGPWVVFAPETHSPYLGAVAVRLPSSTTGPTARTGYVALAHRAGAPDAVMDRIMRTMQPDYVPDHTPGAVRAASVHVWQDGPGGRSRQANDRPDGLTATIAAVRDKAYTAGELVRARGFMRSTRAERATDDDRPVYLGLGGDGELGRGGTEAWFDWYSALRHALTATGGLDAHLAHAAAIAAARHEPGHTVHAPTRELEAYGRQLAFDTHGLPGEAERVALAQLYTAAVEGRLEQRSLGEARTVRAICLASGFTDPDHAFDFNDLDSTTFALSPEGWAGLAMSDQNRCYALYWQGPPELETLVVHSWPPAPRATHPAARLQGDAIRNATSRRGTFTVRAGQVRATAPLDDHLSAARSWNGLLFETGSAACSLEADGHRLPPAPAPTAPDPAPVSGTRRRVRR